MSDYKELNKDLKGLFNPKKYHEPISIENQDIESLNRMLRLMLIIRKTEQQLAL